MAFVHGKSTKVLGDSADFSSWLNATDWNSDIDMAEVTAYGAESKAYIPGLDDGQITHGGMFDSDGVTDLQATILDNLAQSVANGAWSVAPSGFALGSDAATCKVRLASHSVSAPVGDVVAIGVTVQSDGGVWDGVSLHNIDAAETGAGNETSIDQTTPTTDGAVASVHLIDFTGTSIDIVVQQSTDNVVWVDLINFASLTAEGSEHASVEGAVARYIRAEWSGTFTSATFAIVFARR